MIDPYFAAVILIGGGASALRWYTETLTPAPGGVSSLDVTETELPRAHWNPPAGTDIDRERYAISRTIASEAGGRGYTDAERVAIGWVVRNHYYSHKRSVFSGQGSAHPQKGGYASSALNPTAESDRCAARCYDGSTVDPTGGAVSFFEPKLQDALFAKGKVRFDAQGIRARWSSPENRMELYAVIGSWEFYGRRGKRNSP